MRRLILAMLALGAAGAAPDAAEAQQRPSRKTAKEDSPLVRAEGIILPVLQFNDGRLDAVAARLSELSAKADPGGVGVRIVYAGPKDDVPAWSIDLRNTPLSHVLKLLSQSMGYRTTVKDGAILLEPR
ncbi:MAG: hypothetical protein ACO3ND_06920 [Opitutales bacterium]